MPVPAQAADQYIWVDFSHIIYGTYDNSIATGIMYSDGKMTDGQLLFTRDGDDPACTDVIEGFSPDSNNAVLKVRVKNITGGCDETDTNIALQQSPHSVFKWIWSDANTITSSDGGLPFKYSTAFGPGVFVNSSPLEDSCIDTITATSKDQGQLVLRSTGHTVSNGKGSVWTPGGTSFYDGFGYTFQIDKDQVDNCTIYKPITIPLGRPDLAPEALGGKGGASTTGPGPSASGDLQPTCDAGALTWLLCPIISIAQGAITFLEGKVKDALSFDPIQTGTPLYAIWSAMRDIADVLFILVFFVVIFGTAFDLDNYGVKKRLPKIIAGAVIVQFSFIGMSIANDATNVVIYGLNTLPSFIPGATAGNSATTMVWGGIEGIALGIGGAALAISLSALPAVLLAVLSALLAIVALFVALEVRQIFFFTAVAASPIAAVLWALDEKYGRGFVKFVGAILITGPTVILLFVMGDVVGIIAIRGGTADLWSKIIGSLAPIIVFFASAGIITQGPKLLTGALGIVTGAGQRGQKGIAGAQKNAAERRREQQLRKYADMSRSGNTGFLRGSATRAAAGLGVGRGKVNPMSRAGRRIESAIDKAAQEQGAAEALVAGREKLGVSSFADSVAAARNANVDKMTTAAIASAGASTRALGTAGTATRIDSAPLNQPGVISDLRRIAEDSRESFATRAAAIQRLATSAGGRHELSDMRTTSMGGNGTQLVSNENAELWRQGTASLKAEAAPDLVRGDNGFKGVSAEEFAALDPKAKGRYFSAAAASGDPTRVAEARENVRVAMSDPRISNRMGTDDRAAIAASGYAPTGPVAPAPVSPGPTGPVAPVAAATTGNTGRFTPPAPTGPRATPPPNTGGYAPTGPGGLYVPPGAPGTVVMPTTPRPPLVDPQVETAGDDPQDPRAIS
ncbi:MAG TPA: hypothetical protein VLF67_05395 [Candidatus Saccharimonas sp.]|nr:hypothetical protein [Candidatus Saccharimonas sp.]